MEYLFKLLTKSKEVAFDIESIKFTSEITVLGFATSPFDGYAISLRDFDVHEIAYIYRLTKDLLTRSDLTVFIQNAQFEKSMMRPHIGEITCKVFDTMLAHHLCYSTFPKSLKFLTSIYTNEPYYKDEIASDLLTYNCKDTTVTFEIAKVLQAEMLTLGVSKLYYDLMPGMVDIVSIATFRGLRVDKSKQEEVSNYLHSEFLRLQNKLNTFTPSRHVNVNSPLDMKWFVYTHLGFKHRQGNTDAKVLESLIKRHKSKELELVLEIRQILKINSFITKDFWDEDGRCRCHWNLHGTKTGRLSTTIEDISE